MPYVISAILVLIESPANETRSANLISMFELCGDLAKIDCLRNLMVKDEWPQQILEKLHHGEGIIRALGS